SDQTFNDTARLLRIPASKAVKEKAAAALRVVSPGSILGIAAAIRYDWQEAEASAAAWEAEYAADVGVQSALAVKFTQLNRLEDALRCRQRILKLAPNQDAYRELAAVYKEQKDE